MLSVCITSPKWIYERVVEAMAIWLNENLKIVEVFHCVPFIDPENPLLCCSDGSSEQH